MEDLNPTPRNTGPTADEYYRIANNKLPLVSGSRLRSWSLPDNKTNGSTDSENSIIATERPMSGTGRQPERLNDMEFFGGFMTSMVPPSAAESESVGLESYAEKWNLDDTSTSHLFTSNTAEKKKFSAVDETVFIDNSATRVSPDAVAMTHSSPNDCNVERNPQRLEKYDPLVSGFGTGIADFPRTRGCSIGSEVSTFGTTHDDRFNIEYMPSDQLGNEFDELEQAGQHLLSTLNPMQGHQHSSPFGAWASNRDESIHDYHQLQGHFQGRSSRIPCNESLSLADLPQSDYHSYVSTGVNSRDEPYSYSNSRQSRSPAYSGCPSPAREHMHHPPMSSNRMEFSQDIHYKSNAPVKNHSQPQFVAEDYLEGNRRHSTDYREGLAFDKGQQQTDGHIYQVQFKRCYRCFRLQRNFPQLIKLGEFVIVEADRGEDLGVVVAIAPEDSPLSMSIYAASALSMRMMDSDFSKKILRVASMQERADLPFKRQQEIILLEVCRDRARDSYALPITLLDAEYQFDRNKLVLHYSASRRIDFREFVRDLFAVYKTRIWMEQATSNSNFVPSEAVSCALQTGHLQLNPLLPQAQWSSGDVSPTYSQSPGSSSRGERRRQPTSSAQYPRREFYGHQQTQQESQYQQNLMLQEMRLAQHPHRLSDRYSVDQKCKELQLQKERELNEALDRGVSEPGVFPLASLPYY